MEWDTLYQMLVREILTQQLLSITYSQLGKIVLGLTVEKVDNGLALPPSHRPDLTDDILGLISSRRKGETRQHDRRGSGWFVKY